MKLHNDLFPTHTHTTMVMTQSVDLNMFGFGTSTKLRIPIKSGVSMYVCMYVSIVDRWW